MLRFGLMPMARRLLLCAALSLSLFSSALAVPIFPANAPALTAEERRSLNEGETVVSTSDFEDGITGVIGRIRIDASAASIWRALTDYDNHKDFVPKLKDSRLISDNGTEQEVYSTGRTGVLFFKKTVTIQFLLKGDYPNRLSFHQTKGDFRLYRGEWTITSSKGVRGKVLTFRAHLKPDFFAPDFFCQSRPEKRSAGDTHGYERAGREHDR